MAKQTERQIAVCRAAKAHPSWTAKQVADAVGVSHSYTDRILRDAGIPVRRAEWGENSSKKTTRKKKRLITIKNGKACYENYS